MARDATPPRKRLPVNTGHREVVDADMSNYFGEIPHAELVQSVARRVGFASRERQDSSGIKNAGPYGRGRRRRRR